MSKELLGEDFVPFSKAPQLLPGRPHISTLHRWRIRGLKGVKLQTILVGGRRYVSKDELLRFVNQLSDETSTTAGRRTPSRQRQIEAANRACDKAGI
ncbi:MAG: DUF1580 domain-containing protein [bacterium]|nr:DUF1580 domain-containing protein [bacterium]